MFRRLFLISVLLVACNSEPTLDARDDTLLWSSFDVIAQANPELAPALEQAILDIRDYFNSGAGSRRVEIMGLAPSDEERQEKSEQMIQAALQGKTANDVIKLAQALNRGDEAAENLLNSPVFF
jgi:hypothetical protein